MKHPFLPSVLVLSFCAASWLGAAETPPVPDWALPGSATHQQVPPPAGFHRPTRTIAVPLGIFDGQSDVGGPLVPGAATYDPATQRYTIHSAGYNIWYNRDEFRYLWTKRSGDLSLAASIEFPNPAGYDDRKVVLVIRQDLDDDAKEVMAGLHGAGLIHLAYRPEKDAAMTEQAKLKSDLRPRPGHPVRIGIEKHGDAFTLYVSEHGEPLHQVGTAITLRFTAPFYVGIGFTSHLPVTVDTAVVSEVVLKEK